MLLLRKCQMLNVAYNTKHTMRYIIATKLVTRKIFVQNRFCTVCREADLTTSSWLLYIR